MHFFFNHQVLWGLGGWGEAGSGQVHLPQWRCLHCKNIVIVSDGDDAVDNGCDDDNDDGQSKLIFHNEM